MCSARWSLQIAELRKAAPSFEEALANMTVVELRAVGPAASCSGAAAPCSHVLVYNGPRPFTTEALPLTAPAPPSPCQVARWLDLPAGLTKAKLEEQLLSVSSISHAKLNVAIQGGFHLHLLGRSENRESRGHNEEAQPWDPITNS